MNNLKKSMVLDGIAASEAIDSSGEILDIRGLDISDAENGFALLNYEHRGDQSEGASSNDIIGHITFAKKIFGADDCDNDRELSYWNKVQLPFVYIQAELFNDEGHPGAQAAAALIRYYERRKMPIVARYSIEGSTLERDGNKLKRAIFKRLALTVKPCNRSCVSGVISDSDSKAKPQSKKDEFSDLALSEPQNPHIIGSYEGEFEPIVSDPMEKMRSAIESLREINDLNKALSIGGGDAAPTTLTGGAALAASVVDTQSKKKHKFIKNQALAALRDWKGNGDLRTFLKHRLPDTSDEFLDHFSKLVNDYHLKKTMALEDKLFAALRKGEPKAPVAVEQQAPKNNRPNPWKGKKDDDEEVEVGDSPLTIRGKKIRPLNSINGSHFDERKGILFTPRGSFKLYLPQHDKTPGATEAFHNILKDPKANAFHDYATSNWLKVHKLLKAGKLPPEVIMHSTLFSQLSPNTPVPMQELMYSHLVDSMKDTGIDARDPKFSSIKRDWVGRDSPTVFPTHSQDYFEGPTKRLVTLKNPSKLTGRQKGDIGGFMLANNKFKGMQKYHSLHNSLVDLFGRHGTDARGAVEELMAHKHKAGLWEARRDREITKGRPDPGEYAEGPAVPGLAPKTGRYMAAMIGGGNVHVPDTHFTRYLFGLEKGTDARSIQYLKNVLWNENNSHVLNGIDRFYAAHHPAVQYMMDHPTFGKQFSNREDAIFPAFWRNWIAINPHERARNMNTQAYNEATDHRPFWEAIAPYVKNEVESLDLEKSEGVELPLRTAKLHAEWVKKYGEVPAQMLYYAHIVPQLLRASRKTEDVIVKMERIAAELRKGMEPAPEPQLPPLPETNDAGLIPWKGKKVKPGKIEVVSGPYQGSKMVYIDNAGDNAPIVHPEGDPGKLLTLPAHEAKRGWRVLEHPTEVKVPNYVDATKHIDPGATRNFNQKLLVHGIDLTAKQKSVPKGATATTMSPLAGWYYSAAGKSGYVKPAWTLADHNWEEWDPMYGSDQNKFSLAHREALFHNMANEFFGLGAHVPNTALFSHPKTGTPMSVMERVPNGMHYEHDDDEHANILHGAYANGTLDKLALMDGLMGNGDRHEGNYMLTREAPNVHLIDNGLSLDYGNPMMLPGHLENHHDESGDPTTRLRDRAIHPAALDWMLGLSHTGFLQHLLKAGVPQSIAKAGFQRFGMAQLAALTAKNQGQPLTFDQLMGPINKPIREFHLNAARQAAANRKLGA